MACTISRPARMAKLLARHGFSLAPVRVVDADEAAFVAVGDPHRYRVPERFVGGVMVSYADTCRMRMRAAAARVYLARRLARRAVSGGLAVAWRGTAREAQYEFLAHRAAWRSELGR